MKLHHPVSEDLAFLYGTILTDGKDDFSDEPTANVCVFADAQVRPCTFRCPMHIDIISYKRKYTLSKDVFCKDTLFKLPIGN